MMYLGDYVEDDTLYFLWSTNDADGASITRATNGTISVYKDNGTSQTTAGITDTEDFDSLTGIHACTINLAADAFYATGADYAIILSAATIDGATVNAVLAHFSIQNRYMRGTDSANTTTPPTVGAIADAVWDEALAGHLAAGAAGYALNYAGGQTPPTTTAIADAVWTTATRTLSAGTNIGFPTAANVADQVWANATRTLSANTNFNDLNAAAVAAAVWNAARSSYTGTGSFGQGVASVQGNVTGSAASVSGSVGSVAGSVTVGTINSNVITAASIAADALTAAKFSADVATEIATGVWSAAGRTLTGDSNINYPSAATIATQVWANATRTLSANTNFNDLNAAAVAAAVWNALRSSHTTAGSFGQGVASVQGAVTSVTNGVSVTSLAADSITASALATDGVTEIVTAMLGAAVPGAYGAGTVGNIIGNSPTSSSITTLLNTRIEAYRLHELLHTAAGSPPVSGSVIGELTEDDGGILRFNTNALEMAPTGGGASISAIADEVWNRALAGHATAGTAGKALADAQSGGDPWSTAVPGSYSSGQAGYVLDAISDAIGALPTATGIRQEIDTNSTKLATINTTLTTGGTVYTNLTGIKAKTDLIPALPAAVSNIPTAAQIRTEMDANSTVLLGIQTTTNDIDSTLTSGGAVYNAIAAIGSKTTNLPALPAATGDIPNASSIASAVLSTAVPGAFGVGTVGHTIGTNLNATVGSRSTLAAADVWSSATRTLSAATNLSIPSAADIWTYGTRTITNAPAAAPTAQQIWEYATRTLTSAGAGGATANEVWEYATATGLVANVSAVKAKTDLITGAPATAADVPTLEQVQGAAEAALETYKLDELVAATASGPSPLSLLGHMVEQDGSSYRFKANALEQAPAAEGGGGTIDTQTLVNAVLNEPTATHTGNGTVGRKLHDLINPTTDHIAASVWRAPQQDYGNVAGTFGELLDAPITGMFPYEAGFGSVTFIYTVTNALNSQPIPDVLIAVTSDNAGNVIIARGMTNEMGQVTFHLDPGTYYLWRTKTGYTFTNPDTEVIAP